MKTPKVGKKIDMEALRKKYLPLKEDDMRFLPPAAMEAFVFKFLRCMATQASVKMSGAEHAQWLEAKDSGLADDFADENGWVVSQSVPSMVKTGLSQSVDYLAFAEGWERAIGKSWPLTPSDEWVASLTRYVNSVSERGLWDRKES